MRQVARPHSYIRSIMLGVGLSATLLCMLLVGVFSLEHYVTKRLDPLPLAANTTPEPFPVGVNVHTQVITELPLTDHEYIQTLAQFSTTPRPWWQRALVRLHRQTWYQQVASLVTHSFVVWPGQRREEVITHIAGILRWDAEETAAFESLITETIPELGDGTFFPGRYLTHRFATPHDIATLTHERFATEVLARYTPEVAAAVPLADTLTIASIIEREARDFSDMREISGIIWNRLFIDMPLQLDATLQYARANETPSRGWWPVPRPADKQLDSPFNTYQHTGLPPHPISNPSLLAIIAALNPRETDCLFYFHDRQQNFFCSVTYDEHRSKLQAAYGL